MQNFEKPNESAPSGKEKADERLRDMMPPKAEQFQKSMEVEQEFHSAAEEAKRLDDTARADIIASFKQGKQFTNKLPGIDNDTFQSIKSGLNSLSKNEHLATLQMEVENENGKVLYIKAINDVASGKALYFFKENSDFDPGNRLFLRDLNDSEYRKLVGKNRKK